MNDGNTKLFAQLRLLLSGTDGRDDPELLAAVDAAERAVEDAWEASTRVCEAKALELAARHEALSWRSPAEIPDQPERLARLDFALKSVRECISGIDAAKRAGRTPT